LGLAVIPDYPGEGETLSWKYHTWKDSCQNWSQMITDNVKIGPRIRPYQPEAFGPSSPGLGFGTKNFFIRVFFCPVFSTRKRGFSWGIKKPIDEWAEKESKNLDQWWTPTLTPVARVVGGKIIFRDRKLNDFSEANFLQENFKVSHICIVEWIHKSSTLIFSQLMFLSNIWTALFEKEPRKAKLPYKSQHFSHFFELKWVLPILWGYLNYSIGRRIFSSF